MTASALRIASLCPDVLGTYGDGGNVTVLMQRLAWRQLPAELVTVGLDSPVPAECDLYVLGGGEDEAQLLALSALRRGGVLAGAVDRGAHVFAVCAGLQLLGTSLQLPGGRSHDGLGLLDLTTAPRWTRAVGEVVATPDPALGIGPLTGFENHGGGSRLGPQARPLAAIRTGVGNGGQDVAAGEGALQGTVIATYLHGPVLARNPGLADHVLSRALGTTLAGLSHPEIDLLRRERLLRQPARPRQHA